MFTTLVVLLLISMMQLCEGITIGLSYPLTSGSPYFPSQTRFNLTQTNTTRYNISDTLGPFVLVSNVFESSEHMGTHLDAPSHFSTGSWSVDQIPLERLVGVRRSVFNVSAKCLQNSSYQIVGSDIDFNILDKSTSYFVIMFYMGWSRYWPSQEQYAGGRNMSELRFPGISFSLAQSLVDKYAGKLVGVGIDTLSSKTCIDSSIIRTTTSFLLLVDYGQSSGYLAHRILLKNNIYALENVASLDQILSKTPDVSK